MMKRALFIFRRDLRLQDNRALLSALENAEEVILSFIFTQEQIEYNNYRSDRSLQFMIESLEDLEKEILTHKGKLYLFYGKPEKIIEECIDKLNIEGVFVNADYTPYSLDRDKKIEVICNKHSVFFESSHDLLLHLPEDTLKKDDSPYTIFTPFYSNASKLPVLKPHYNKDHRYYNQPILFSKTNLIYEQFLPNRKKQLLGGRQAALKIINELTSFSDYTLERNFPALDKTTHLSPHLKFNTCSVREIYYAIRNCFGSDSDLIRSLYWRDFFTLIALFFPHVFGEPFKKKFNSLKWNQNKELFDLWCQGKTGFPIVDAGMRELNETGFMHNRVRMITASFLVKDLHVNWQWGEKYFAQHLIDYDPAVNNGNWQWAASTGCDAQPYFRIFNPWLQAKKFDPDCEYIKKWIPELSSLTPQIIHSLYLQKNNVFCKDYPAPIINHSIEASSSLQSYKECF